MTMIPAQNFGTLLNLMKQIRSPLTERFLIVLLASLIVTFAASNSYAVVKFFDGFGDADLDNDGVPLDWYDVDVGGDSFDRDDFQADPNGYVFVNTVFSWSPGRLDDGDPNTDEPRNDEITSVLDADDTGLPWYQMRGFTGNGQGASKPTARILDDTTGAMLETTAVGPPGALGKKAINTGYALSIDGRGRGSPLGAFFGENVALGPEQGDKLRVSFDFRYWRDVNTSGAILEDGELRFGLFQDTDSQLGLTNPIAGRVHMGDNTVFPPLPDIPTPAIWGEEEGRFEGGQVISGNPDSEIGSIGDLGWFGAVILEDPDGQFPPFIPNGGGWRIREEGNDLNAGGPRIFLGSSSAGGDQDNVAKPTESSPGAGDFGLTNLDINNVWHLSLELVRDLDPNNGAAAISANLSAFDVDDPNTVFTLSGTEPTNDPNGNVTVSADNFDYFAIRLQGLDHFDILLDNFMLEIEGSNVPGNADFDGSGFVDGRDFMQWQRGDTPEGGSPDELALWEAQYGGPPPLSAAVAAVPEPASILLFLFGLMGMRLQFSGDRSRWRQ